ncbi:MAG: EAL domain-containing protein [Sulfuritalea sp.]|nr:EAL domain-containing protein [Sulfuritalea sp.]
MTPRDFTLPDDAGSMRSRADLWPAWLALVCALALTLLAWSHTREDIERQQRRDFDAEVERVRSEFENHVLDHARTLQAAAALFASGRKVTREEWRNFVAGLGLERNYPAIRGLGFARAVGGRDAVRHGEEQVLYVLAEPDAGFNRELLGRDLRLDARWRDSLQRARETGGPSISGRFAFAAEAGGVPDAAFSMMLPVIPASGAALQGYVLGTLHMPTLMADFLKRAPRAVALTIRDGGNSGPEQLLYGGDAKEQLPAKFVHEETLQIGGQQWAVSYASQPQPTAFMTRSTQVLAGGLLTSMLLFTIAWSFATNRDHARRLAEKMTQSLRESEARFRVLVEQAPDAIIVYDVDRDRLVDANVQAEKLFGCEREALLAGPMERFYPTGLFAGKSAVDLVREMVERALGGGQISFDRTIRTIQGDLVRCEMRVVRLPAVDRKLIRASFIDISERKRAEEDLRIAAITFESQDGVMITDADMNILRVNRAFCEITGYSPEDVVGRTPRILKSRHHDRSFYESMWSSISDSGTWCGEIWNRRKSGEIYPGWLGVTAVKGRRGSVTHYVGTFSDITQRKAAEDEIRHLAFYDALTGLPNRRLMLERLKQALATSARHGRHGALMLFDLDDFKTLNDSLGHDVGDQFLVEVAARLAACIREVDTVARLGGDEFVIILEDLDPEALAAMQVESVAVKIQAALGEPYLLDLHPAGGDLDTRSYQCTSSIGITLFRDQSHSVDELMKRADTAMYQAKAAGRNALRFFDPEMQAAVSARAALDADLRRAVAEGQFVLHFQRQVDTVGLTTGVEALVRWRHPVRGMVHPAEFIRQAEETRLIVPLGRWVLEAACRQLAVWSRHEDLARLTIAVNVSGRQFHQPDFVEQVIDVLQETGANPRRLKLEVTESVLLQDIEEVVAKMTVLKAEGLSFSLDDFGTGYSSLLYLKRLPLDELKIDYSFVHDVLKDANDAVIASTIIGLGQSLGLAVIAEGVETEAQRRFLAAKGCHAYQGNLFGAPGPADDIFAELMTAS